MFSNCSLVCPFSIYPYKNLPSDGLVFVCVDSEFHLLISRKPERTMLYCRSITPIQQPKSNDFAERQQKQSREKAEGDQNMKNINGVAVQTATVITLCHHRSFKGAHPRPLCPFFEAEHNGSTGLARTTKLDGNVGYPC